MFLSDKLEISELDVQQICGTGSAFPCKFTWKTYRFFISLLYTQWMYLAYGDRSREFLFIVPVHCKIYRRNADPCFMK